MDNVRVEVRNLTLEDYNHLKESMIEAYSTLGDNPWRLEALASLIQKFPEGQLVVLVNDKVVGCALSIIVDYKRFQDNHTYQQITGNYSFDTHNPDGDTLYGIEVFIRSESRGLRLARRLYDARKVLCEGMNLRAIVVGGRMPNYQEYAEKLNPKAYIQKVKSREIYDPTLSFQLANDFQIKRIIQNYLPEDYESHGYATLLVWYNVYYEPTTNPIKQKKEYCRIGVIQWQMRPYSRLEDLMEQVEYFVDAVSDYNSDFAVLPELFNAPLMGSFNHLPGHEAITYCGCP
jgi:ribosomal protein S18 acetylase RimI-like enzyme